MRTVEVQSPISLSTANLIFNNSQYKVKYVAGGLGGIAHGTIQVAVKSSFLIPYPLNTADENKHVFAIAGALAAFGQSVRDASQDCTAFGDADTADLFTEISRGIDQQLWLVESHLAPAD